MSKFFAFSLALVFGLMTSMSWADVRSKTRARKVVIENFGGRLDTLRPEGRLLIRLINQFPVEEQDLDFFHAVAQQEFKLTHQFSFFGVRPLANPYHSPYAPDLKLLYSMYRELMHPRQKELFLLEICPEQFDLKGYDLVRIRPQFLRIRSWLPESEYEFFVLKAARSQFGKGTEWLETIYSQIHRVDNAFAMQAIQHLIYIVYPRMTNRYPESEIVSKILAQDFRSAFQVQTRNDLHAFMNAELVLAHIERIQPEKISRQTLSETLLPTVRYLVPEQQEFLERLLLVVEKARAFEVVGEDEPSQDLERFTELLARTVALIPFFESPAHTELLFHKVFLNFRRVMVLHSGWLELIPELSAEEAEKLLPPPSSARFQSILNRCRHLLKSLGLPELP